LLTQIVNALNDPTRELKPALLDADMAEKVQQIPRAVVPDMPDRIIAATALHLNLPLVTADHKIQAVAIQTIW
jgi:predicted nucleic acid-binding protein